MLKTFRAKKMIERVKREGLGHLLDDATLELINKLDGEQGNDYNWESVVKGEDLVWIEKTDEHDGVYVALCDCD